MNWSSRKLNLFCLYLQKRSLICVLKGRPNLENLIN